VFIFIYLIFKMNTDLNMLDIRIIVHHNSSRGRVGAIFMPISQIQISGDFKIPVRSCPNILIQIYLFHSSNQ
jgi:hypothetical protein